MYRCRARDLYSRFSQQAAVSCNAPFAMRFYLFFVLFARRDVHPKKSTRFSPPRPSRGSPRPLERVFPLSVRRPGRDRGGGGGSQRPLERVFHLSVRRPGRDRGGGGGSQRPLERVSQPPLHMSGSGWRAGGGAAASGRLDVVFYRDGGDDGDFFDAYTRRWKLQWTAPMEEWNTAV